MREADIDPAAFLAPANGVSPCLPGDWPAYYRLFAAAVRGDGPVPVDPADAVVVAQVLEAAVVSSASGHVVPVVHGEGKAQRPVAAPGGRAD